jgi:putative restriction endonuclease
MWRTLLAMGSPTAVRPSMLQELGIYRGGQGIWVNKDQTSGLTNDGGGVTVGLLHTGQSYADDLSADDVLYHYPATNRPTGRDLSEIEATKAAGQMGLPVFVVTPSHSGRGKRHVHLGLVEEWDDSLEMFLVTFMDSIRPLSPVTAPEEEPFNLTERREAVRREVKARPGQQRFSFQVLKRYGPKCAVCRMSIPEVLEAAHLVPNSKAGSFDPRNGLVLCASHHRALDAGLFAVEPSSLEIRYKASGPDAKALRVDYRTLEHLPNRPHKDALEWRWKRWRQ